MNMNLPTLKSYEEQAVDTVVSVINRAKESLGMRQSLTELATSREDLSPRSKVILTSLKCPLAITSEQLIRKTIEKKWNLCNTFMYVLNYMGASRDECSQYYYYEAIFSQPTAAYPIAQATVSVFFRVQDKHVEPPEVKGVPKMTFRVEGHRWDHDIRYILLFPDWLLAVIKMKTKFFQRLEEIRIF